MKQITLQEMKDGEVIDEVNEAICVIAQNILDEKTNTLKPRAVNLKLIFKKELDEDGDPYIHISYQLKNDLQPRTEFIAGCQIDDVGIIGMKDGFLDSDDILVFKNKKLNDVKG